MIPTIGQLIEDGWAVEIGPHYGGPQTGFYCTIYHHNSEGPGDECEECGKVSRSYDDAEHADTADGAFVAAYHRFVMGVN